MGANESLNPINMSRTIENDASDQTVEVLYQKLGDRWYAFSLINDEVFVGSITQNEIDGVDQAEAGRARSAREGVYKISGNS